MGYYWFHRAAHEINLFWAAHVVSKLVLVVIERD
jgi:hypothetical protein